MFSFFVPLSIMLIAFALSGIAPFGNRNLMAMDAYAQYFPMLRQLVRERSDWSFAGGLGYNQVTQSAYYTNSPLWLLLYLLPQTHLIEGIHGIVLLRFGLAGLTFAFFIHQTTGFRSPFSFVFATAYALSAYNLAFINQFMWMDCVVLLPLLAAALQHMWEKERFLPVVAVLSCALYSNFYLSFFLCLFAALWSLVLLFGHKQSTAKRLQYLVRFILASSLSAGLVAFVLLPTYLGLKHTLAAQADFPDQVRFYHPLWAYILKFFPFVKVSLAFEAANLYCGLTAVVLVVVFYLRRKRTHRERLSFTCFAVGSYLSFNVNVFDYLWHGFHFPNQLPARQSFLFVFVLLILAYRAYTQDPFPIQLPGKTGKKRPKGTSLKAVIATILLIEVLANAVVTLAAYTWKANHRTYTAYEADMHDITQTYAAQDEAFYRMAFLKPSHNQGLRYGYQGIGHYSSLMSGTSYRFFQDIGMDAYAKNVSVDYVPDALLNTLFGVRYLFQIKAEPHDIDELNLIKRDELDQLIVYENPTVWPLVFCLTDIDVRHSRATELKNLLGPLLNESQPGNGVSFLTMTSCSPTKIKGRLSLDQDGQLLTSIGGEDGWIVRVDGQETKTFNAFDYMLAAPLKAGQHEIELAYETPGKRLGLWISCASLLLLVSWFWIEKGLRRKGETREASHLEMR